MQKKIRFNKKSLREVSKKMSQKEQKSIIFLMTYITQYCLIFCRLPKYCQILQNSAKEIIVDVTCMYVCQAKKFQIVKTDDGLATFRY